MSHTRRERAIFVLGAAAMRVADLIYPGPQSVEGRAANLVLWLMILFVVVVVGQHESAGGEE